MAHTCELYFFVKLVTKKPKFEILRTVIWNLGREDSAVKGAAVQQLKVGVTPSLAVGGLFGPLVDAEIFYVTQPGITRPQAEAMLQDPSFTWKDGAFAISLHCATVSVVDQPETNPFCVPKP